MSDWIYVIEIANIINTFIEEIKNYIHVAGNSIKYVVALRILQFVLAYKAAPTHHN